MKLSYLLISAKYIRAKLGSELDTLEHSLGTCNLVDPPSNIHKDAYWKGLCEELADWRLFPMSSGRPYLSSRLPRGLLRSAIASKGRESAMGGEYLAGANSSIPARIRKSS